MAQQQSRTLNFPVGDPAEVERLRTLLLSQGFALRPIQHSILAGIRDTEVVTLYSTGRLLIQGQNVDNFILTLNSGSKSSQESRGQSYLNKPSQVKREPWIGTDESGKGDYFGPLVIAGVRLDSVSAPKVNALGVRDSKTLSDSAIHRLGRELMGLVPYAIVSIGPERYNELYTKMRNINSILAWGHARCIENILEKTDASLAITDQFGDERYIDSALMQRGKTINLEQRPRAEEDLAVSSASILARLGFVTGLDKLSNEAGIQLPKGVGPEVEVIAKKLFAQKGEDALFRSAKLHFKTTAKALGRSYTS